MNESMSDTRGLLSEKQQERYGRNILLPQVGEEGQRTLLNSKVLVIGAGGLGSPVLLYLAAAGLGTLGVIDGDTVDLSNLQRQIAHTSEAIGQPKVVSASERMHAINPEVKIELHNQRLTADGGAEIVRKYDFVVEATDNFEAKFLVNDLCVAENVPFSHGGILEFTGQTMTVVPGSSSCYRCVFTEQPPAAIAEKCSKAGVLGAVAGVIGSIQAAEAVKFLLGCGELLTDVLLTMDALGMRFRRVPILKRADCTCSGSLRKR